MRLAILSSHTHTHTHTRSVAVILGHTECILKCDSVTLTGWTFGQLTMRYTQSLVYLAFHVTSTARGKNVPVGIINMLCCSNVLICSSVNRMFTITQNNNKHSARQFNGCLPRREEKRREEKRGQINQKQSVHNIESLSSVNLTLHKWLIGVEYSWIFECIVRG